MLSKFAIAIHGGLQSVIDIILMSQILTKFEKMELGISNNAHDNI